MNSRTIRTLVAALLLALAVASPRPAQAQDARKVINRVNPVYPPLARKMNVAGTVKVEVTISPAGNVTDTKVIGGHPLLISAATDALKRWKYEAAGETTNTTVEFRFNLSE
ncbi:MAG: energy transducer TonB [Terriglobales bacterium]